MINPALASRLEMLRAAKAHDASTLDRFADHLLQAAEHEVFRMSPVRYAGPAGMSENAAIDLFLRATHAGVLDLSWGVLCPACSSFISTVGGLRSLAERRRCSLCQIDIALDDDAVEIGFTVSQAVRAIAFHNPDANFFGRDWRHHFFSSSARPPAEFAERFAQGFVGAAPIPAGQTHTFELELTQPRYFLLAPTEHAFCHLEVSEKETAREHEVQLVEGRIFPERVWTAPGKVKVRVNNRSSKTLPMGVVCNPVPSPEARAAMGMHEPPRMPRAPYLTAKRLATHQTFRDLFRAQSLPGEEGLEFKSMTVLFTDLKGSTEMYERIGDLRAYTLVREHFQVLREAVVSQGGSLVKTIGDAVMASFSEPAPALEAAVRMNRDVKRVGAGADLELKLGLHTGPCIAVDSNERLDYFGQTVNVAARVQGIAAANEIACTDAVYRAPGVEQVLIGAALKPTKDRAHLKGVGGEVTIWRLR